jgi:hypothetical protein
MTHISRRWTLFAVASVGGLGLVAVLLLLVTQPPRSIPSPTPTLHAVALVDGQLISFEQWQRAVAVDQVMSALVGQPPPSPQETLDQLINESLVLQAATDAGLPRPSQDQVQDWLAGFMAGWGLDETALDQALGDAGLSHAEFAQEIVPRLLRVQQALQELPASGDEQAWIADLRRQAEIEVLQDFE